MTPLAQAAYRAHEAELVATGRVLPRQPMIFTLGRDAAAFARQASGEAASVPASPEPPATAADAAAHAGPRAVLPAPVPPPVSIGSGGSPRFVGRDTAS